MDRKGKQIARLFDLIDGAELHLNRCSQDEESYPDDAETIRLCKLHIESDLKKFEAELERLHDPSRNMGDGAPMSNGIIFKCQIKDIAYQVKKDGSNISVFYAPLGAKWKALPRAAWYKILEAMVCSYKPL